MITGGCLADKSKIRKARSDNYKTKDVSPHLLHMIILRLTGAQGAQSWQNKVTLKISLNLSALLIAVHRA